MINYIQGNIFDTNESLIVHGCNCFNSMGAGIAAQVAKSYPAAMLVDTLTDRGDKSKLGSYTAWTGHNIFRGGVVTIVNAYTQYNYTKHEVDVDYGAVLKVMELICKDFSESPIAMPLIGCGLAGGDWGTVVEILETVSDEYRKTFHIYYLTPPPHNCVFPCEICDWDMPMIYSLD